MASRGKFRIEVFHEGLGRSKVVTATSSKELERKAAKAEMDTSFAKQMEQKARKKRAEEHRGNQWSAERQTVQAEKVRKSLNHILRDGIAEASRIRWADLQKEEPFREASPPRGLGQEPDPHDYRYRPRLGVLGRMLPDVRDRRILEAQELFNEDLEKWRRQKDNFAAWDERRIAHLAQQAERRTALVDLRKRYLDGELSAIQEHAELVLRQSKYPDFVPQDIKVQFKPKPGRILVQRYLPDVTSIPTLKKVTYVKSRCEFNEVHISDKEKNDLYNSIIYQICFRTLHELYSADEIGAYELMIFNGRVRFNDPSIGRDAETCPISLQVERAKFAELNLRRADPKECFDRLQGRGHPNLRGYEPVMPFEQFVTEDERFISPKDVINSLPEKANLASLSWGDFEYLIRDLFEKEFANTGEVKVTRASRDGGMDVVVFDNDAIRGGKSVIQAKHYSDSIGVSAVRELYGVVINERANKGLLVTTSHFTAGARELAKSLPIILIDQRELLALLEKHGHKLRVDRGQKAS